MKDEGLNFKGGNPGAVQYGNFINYYQFHPPENRLKLLPTDIWTGNEAFYGLDLGCNAGDLTLSIQEFLDDKVRSCDILGLDIDPMLIERAKEKGVTENVQFMCLDVMNDDAKGIIKDYLKRRKVDKFDAVFCFSLTMWIHLNHGDDGLKQFLSEVSTMGKLIVMEPQPWKCYKTAVKRMKLSNGHFPKFKELEMRQTVEDDINEYLLETCKLLKIYESGGSPWGRKITIYKS